MMKKRKLSFFLLSKHCKLNINVVLGSFKTLNSNKKTSVQTLSPSYIVIYNHLSYSSVKQTPAAPLMARPVTPTTIIKQSSSLQTTGTATTTLQRPPVLQVTMSHTLLGYLIFIVMYKKKDQASDAIKIQMLHLENYDFCQFCIIVVWHHS